MLKRTILSLFFLFSFFIGISQEVVVDFGYPEQRVGLSEVTPLLEKEGRLYFKAIGKEHQGLWVTDGSKEGTTPIAFEESKNLELYNLETYIAKGNLYVRNKTNEALYHVEDERLVLLTDSLIRVKKVFVVEEELYFIPFSDKQEPFNRLFGATSIYKVGLGLNIDLITNKLDSLDFNLSKVRQSREGLIYTERNGNAYFVDSSKKLLLKNIPIGYLDYTSDARKDSSYLYLNGVDNNSSESKLIYKLDAVTGEYQRNLVVADRILPGSFINSDKSYYSLTRFDSEYKLINLETESVDYDFPIDLLDIHKLSPQVNTHKGQALIVFGLGLA